MSAKSRYLSAVLMEAVEETNAILGSSCGLGVEGYDYRANRGVIDFTAPASMVERLAGRARPMLAEQVVREWDEQMREDARNFWDEDAA